MYVRIAYNVYGVYKTSYYINIVKYPQYQVRVNTYMHNSYDTSS